MPTPGSHAYDKKLGRLRQELEDQGVPAAKAEDRAKRMLEDEVGGPSPAAVTDRARGPYGERTSGGAPGPGIELRSPAFSENTVMPPRHAKTEANLSPALEWSEPPEGTEELALLCEDPDAPGGPFLHWVVTGVDPSVRSVDEGDGPDAELWPNSFGNKGYDGPLPPVGDPPHRYFFRLYALDQPTDREQMDQLARGDGAGDVQKLRRALEDHSIATGTLIGLFER